MAGLFGAGSNNPFSSYATNGESPYKNPFADTSKSYDRTMFEENRGEPAFGFYASQSGANQPFKDWLNTYTNQHRMYSDYQGQFAAKGDPTWAFTDYLRDNDPYKWYQASSWQDRGEQNPGYFSPFVQYMSL